MIGVWIRLRGRDIAKASPVTARAAVESLRASNDLVVAAYATRQTVRKEVSYAAVRRPLQVHRRRREEHP